MSANLPNNYQNNFNADKNYVQSLHFPGKGLAAYEVNEVLEMYDNKRLENTKGIYNEGQIIGADPVVNNATGDIIIPAGKIFARNEIVNYPETAFTAPIDRLVRLGVFIQEVVVSGGTNVANNEDPELLDPSANLNPGQFFATSNMETSKRLKYQIQWGWKEDDTNQSPGAVGVFYAAFDLDNGILITAPSATSLSEITDVVATYDRDVNGSYIVEGFEVEFDFENEDRTSYFLDVGAGVANVNGYKITRSSNDRFEVPIDPDVRLVQNDPAIISVGNVEYTETLVKGATGGLDTLTRPDVTGILSVTSEDGLTTYADTTDYVLNGNDIDWSPLGSEPTTGDNYIVTYNFTGAVVQTDKAPVDNVTGIVAPLEITDEAIVRGPVVNTADNTANTPVVELLNVKQGVTTFIEGTDYQLTGSTIEWLATGSQPVAGSTYTASYRYNKTILPDAGSIVDDTFSITNQGTDGDLVDGSTVLSTYNFRLKRIDILELAQNGQIRRIRGVSQEVNPNIPDASSDAIALARIEIDWENDPVIVEESNIAIKQGELQDLKNKLYTQGVLIQEMRLLVEGNLNGATIEGNFADAFVDIDKSDQGKAQTLLITEDTLTMPINTVVGSLDNTANVESFQTLDAADDVITDQSQKTAMMKINPYATFTVPAPVVVDTKIDGQVEDFTDRSIVNAINPDPFSWIKNPGNPNISDSGGEVIIDPPVPTPAFRMTLTKLRDITRTAKKIKKLKPRGKKRTLNIQAKLNAGESLGVVKIGRIKVDTATGEVVKIKRKK